MRLTLTDDDGNTVATEALDDHPDKGALQKALDEIERQAQWRLIEAPEQARKQAEETVRNAQKQAEQDAQDAQKQVEEQNIADEHRRLTAQLVNAPVPPKEEPKEQPKSSAQKV